MIIPEGYTEAEVVETLDKCASLLAGSFVFGYFDRDDIIQEAKLSAIKVINEGKYDPSRPLLNFVYSHMRNQLINFKRNKFKRTDAPCLSCKEGIPCTNGEFCEKYIIWRDTNESKANIIRPLSIDYISDEKEDNMRTESEPSSELEIREVLELIDRELPIEHRALYLQMRAGVNIPKSKRILIEKIVTDIIHKAGIICQKENPLDE